MQNIELVPVTKYSTKIKKLPFYKRINVDYPLLCHDEVAKKLAQVAENLPSGLHLQIDSAYRTKKDQEYIWKIKHKTMKDLVHSPNEGTSPHCTGGAVDISLLDTYGKEINLSEPFGKFYEEPQLVSSKISKKAQEMRHLINKHMLKEGFAPNEKEYWHFSYGDDAWSKHYEKTKIYDEIEDIAEDYYFPIPEQIFIKATLHLRRLYMELFKVKSNY